MTYPKVNWITNGKDWKDYRPAIASDGKTILFERSAAMHIRRLRWCVTRRRDPILSPDFLRQQIVNRMPNARLVQIDCGCDSR